MRIDDVADPERQRLAPHHDLITNEGGQRAGFVFPPGIADLVVVVQVVGEMAIARRS